MRHILTFLAVMTVGLAAQTRSDTDEATALLDHLVGRWTMTGTLGGKPTTHDADARWVLNKEYVEFHEVARDRKPDGTPAFEAIVILAWNTAKSEFMCLFLDNTVGGGLTPEGIARGKRTATAIPVVFQCHSGECPPGLTEHESLHLTFNYDASTDTWQQTIDDVTAGKTSRFGDMKLIRDARR